MEYEEDYTLVILDKDGGEITEITVPLYVFEAIVSEGFNSVIRRALADYEKEMDDDK